MRPLLLFQPLLLTRPHPLCCQTWTILRARLTWWQRCVCGQCQIESCVACRTVRAWMRSVGPVGVGYEEAELEADRWKDAELPYPAASNGREPSAMMEISRTSSPKILNRRSKWARDRVWTRIVSIWGCPKIVFDVLCHISVICNLCGYFSRLFWACGTWSWLCASAGWYSAHWPISAGRPTQTHTGCGSECRTDAAKRQRNYTECEHNPGSYTVTKKSIWTLHLHFKIPKPMQPANKFLLHFLELIPSHFSTSFSHMVSRWFLFTNKVNSPQLHTSPFSHGCYSGSWSIRILFTEQTSITEKNSSEVFIVPVMAKLNFQQSLLQSSVSKSFRNHYNMKHFLVSILKTVMQINMFVETIIGFSGLNSNYLGKKVFLNHSKCLYCHFNSFHVLVLKDLNSLKKNLYDPKHLKSSRYYLF